MKTVRRNIRIKAFQALFQLTQNPRKSVEEAIAFAIRYPLEESEEELDKLDNAEALRLNFPDQELEDEAVEDLLNYLTKVVSGVMENRKYLDQQIDEHLTDWSIQRIDLTNLLILRIAAYELYFDEDISPNIVINEAVELTKSFNNEKASKFVNGVLQGILDAKEA